MLIICGALVNGPYALITTAVSADLVSGATSLEPRGPFGGLDRSISLPLVCRDKVFKVLQNPPSTPLSSQFRAPTPAFPIVSPSPVPEFGAASWSGCSLCSLSSGDSQEPEGQCKGTVYRHGHHRRHRVHRSVTSFWLLAAER